MPQAYKLLTGHTFWVARAQCLPPLPPQPGGSPLLDRCPGSISSSLSSRQTLDPPIDGRSPKFWGEAICNLTIQRPGAKPSTGPRAGLFLIPSPHTHRQNCSLSPHNLLQLQAARCDNGDFFAVVAGDWFWSRLLSIGQLFYAPASPINPQPVAALGLSPRLAPTDLTWTPFPKLHRPHRQPPAPNHATSPPPSITLSIARPRIALVSSAVRVQRIFFFVYCILSVFLLSWESVSARRLSHVARRTSVAHRPSLVCPASASRHELPPIASDLGLYATTSQPFTSFHLLRHTSSPCFLCIRRSYAHACARSTPIGSSFAACPHALDDRDRRRASHAITRRIGRQHPRCG